MALLRQVGLGRPMTRAEFDENMNEFPNKFASIAALKAATWLQVGQVVAVEEYHAGVGGGMLFGRIVAGGTGTDDGGSYIDLTASGLQFEQNFPSYITPEMFGAKGGGVLEESAILQNVLNVGGKILLTRKYRCDNQLIGYTNTQLTGIGYAVIDFSQRLTPFNDANFSLFEFRGTAEGYDYLTADAIEGVNKVSVTDASIYNEGDLIEISMNAEGSFSDPSIGVRSGQLNIVTGVYPLTNNIVLDTQIFDTLYTSDLARIRKITPVENILIENITFLGTGRPETNAAGDQGVGIYFGKNVTVRDCNFSGLDLRSLSFYSCYHFSCENNHLTTDKIGDVNTNVSYGIVYSTSMYGSICNNKLENFRHCIVSSHTSSALALDYHGVSRFIDIEKNYATGNYGDVGTTGFTASHAGIAMHTDAEYINIRANTVSGCRYGINVRRRHVNVESNILTGNRSNIYLSSDYQDVSIKDNILNDCINGIVTINSGWGVPSSNISITGNKFSNYVQGISLDSDETKDNHGLLISDNKFSKARSIGGTYEEAIAVDGVFKGLITNNIINGGECDGISVNAAASLLISNNSICDISNLEANRFGMRFRVPAPEIVVVNNYLQNNDAGAVSGKTNVQYLTNFEV